MTCVAVTAAGTSEPSGSRSATRAPPPWPPRSSAAAATAGAPLAATPLAALRYVNALGEGTEHYPENPNGSAGGLTAFTTTDGRSTIMMPHPERAFRTIQHSWHPSGWGEDGPWMTLFRNARTFVG